MYQKSWLLFPEPIRLSVLPIFLRLQPWQTAISRLLSQQRAGKTKTEIRRLREEETVKELARLLGGVEITEAVLQNAREMKELASQTRLALKKREES